MKETLNDLFEYKSLDRARAKEILTNLAQGKYNISEMAAFMTVFLMRSITVEELTGFRDAMLDLCIRLDLEGIDAMDLCGTGGDGKDTFNISTLSSFVVAAAGQPVAKHGNNGVSSICGSSNLLSHFGYEFKNDKDSLLREIENCGICFLHAPLFHPAMKNVAPVRKDLGVKTFFNMLGPMVNPAFVKKQIVGVFNLELARLYNYLYQQGETRYIIIHSLDGYDEISLTSQVKMLGNDLDLLLKPEDLGSAPLNNEELKGGKSIEDSARIFLNILEGNGTNAQKQVVYANAGVALFCAGKTGNIEDAIDLAKETLDSGKALGTFKKFIDKPATTISI
ncbi:MAG: anthranilate phosphoribosyltransferase [Cyclobacteriaceae bacterium]|nr:anthranilate phosphoribosyltransferase [Cyclobacteriaceae bacterium]